MASTTRRKFDPGLRKRTVRIARSAFLIVAVLCLSLISTSALAVVGPDAKYFEIDGDYGSEIGNFNPNNGDHPYNANEIRDGGNETWANRDTAACTHWTHHGGAPYMGASAYTVRCANVPEGETTRSEQMMTSQFRAGDGTRYFSFAFRLRGFPASLPDGKSGFLTQWHQAGGGSPPLRIRWAALGGKYYLETGVWYDFKDEQGRRARRHFSFPEAPEIRPDTWYRVQVSIDMGAPAGISGCPYCPDNSGWIQARFMDNATGTWQALGTYNGQVGYRYGGDIGALNPPYCTKCELRWKLGIYATNHDYTVDYDNVAYGKRWNDITKDKLIGYHKSVLRLPFDDGASTTLDDKSWVWNGGAKAEPGSDYDNDGTINGGAGYTTGAYGRGMRFNGTNYVSVPADNTDFDFGNYLTVSVWFRTTESPTTNKGLVLIGEWSDTWRVLLYGSGHTLHFGVRHPDDTTERLMHDFPAGTYADGQWHHVVGTFNRFAADGLRMKIYIDGMKVGEKAGLDLPVMRGDKRLTVGKYSVDGYFVGDLDEVNVLNYTMTEQQVEELWLGRGQP